MTITVYELGGRDGFRYCPFCWRTLMAMRHKGIDNFERIPVGYLDKSPIAFTNQGLTPVLVDGERWINDSWEISDYLEDAYSDRSSLFGSDMGRAQASFVSAWVRQLQKPGLTEILLWDSFNHLNPEDRDIWRKDREKRYGRLEDYREGREERVLEWRKRLEPLRVTLSGQPFVSGQNPAYADYIVFGDFQWARCLSKIQLLEPEDPIYAWRERMLDLYDGFARSAPHEAD